MDFFFDLQSLCDTRLMIRNFYSRYSGITMLEKRLDIKGHFMVNTINVSIGY
jgi:hypothetical protein